MDPTVRSKLEARRNRLIAKRSDCIARLSDRGSEFYYENVASARRKGNGDDLFRLLGYERMPVSVETFIYDPLYLGKILQGSVYPSIVDDLVEIFEGDYIEICFGGAIGIGKTTEVAIGVTYEIYLLTCLASPASHYGLIPGSPLAFMNVSVDQRQARRVLFSNVFRLVQSSPYFQHVVPYRKNLRNEIFFPSKNIFCYAVAGTEQAILGEGVFSAEFDELNFMPRVERSKRSTPGETSLYDQAEVITNKLSARIRSRFNARGRLPGHLWFASSARYPNDFTERKEAEARTDPRIFVRHRALWEARPRHYFLPQNFTVEVGDLTRRSRVLDGKEQDVVGKVIDVPMDFYKEFVKDPDKAVRDLAGFSVLSITPFIARRECIRRMFEMGTAAGLMHPFSKVENLPDGRTVPADVLLQGVTAETERIVPQHLHYVQCQREDHWGRKVWKDRANTVPDMEIILCPGLYYAHVDLAKGQRDKCGLVICHITGTREIERSKQEDGRMKVVKETLPITRVDLVLRIVAPPNGEVDLPSIRALFHQFRDLGMQFGKISYDQYQSQESIKALKGAGFTAELFSVDDENATAYEMMRQALYDERVLCYEYPLLERELAQLERDGNKVDHPAHAGSSKDLADCLAAALHHAEEGWRAGAGSLGLFQFGTPGSPVQLHYQEAPRVDPKTVDWEAIYKRASEKLAISEPITPQEEDAIILFYTQKRV